MVLNSGYKEFMFGFIKKVVDTVGPRESGGAEEKEAGLMLEEELKKYCDSTAREDAAYHPRAFVGFIPYAMIAIYLSIAFFWVNPLISSILCVAALAVTLTEFGRYMEVVDFLFPKRVGTNVYGRIKPKEEIKQTVVFSGHLDSAYQFNVWAWFKAYWGVIITVLAIVNVLFVLVVSLIRMVTIEGAFWSFNLGNYIALVGSGGVYRYLWYIMVAVGVVTLPMLFFLNRRSVPGAADNMSGIAISLGVAKYLDDEKKKGGFVPKKTEVLIMGVTGEEAGLRGMRRWLDRHEEEMKEHPYMLINIDTVFDFEAMGVIEKEVSIGAKHDPELVDMIYNIAAKDLGYKFKRADLPFGATDAAEWSRRGHRATNMLAAPFDSGLPPNYHTFLDTYDRIDARSLEAMLDICITFLKKIDSQV
ncbi:MAG: Peptidase family M28 [Candidatus Methanolliviera sp. GoM_oil]|nr:MAG: Peptidase family M28 [Candidatus Methanolliviera sp. GoM_oil]